MGPIGCGKTSYIWAINYVGKKDPTSKLFVAPETITTIRYMEYLDNYILRDRIFPPPTTLDPKVCTEAQCEWKTELKKQSMFDKGGRYHLMVQDVSGEFLKYAPDVALGSPPPENFIVPDPLLMNMYIYLLRNSSNFIFLLEPLKVKIKGKPTLDDVMLFYDRTILALSKYRTSKDSPKLKIPIAFVLTKNDEYDIHDIIAKDINK